MRVKPNFWVAQYTLTQLVKQLGNVSVSQIYIYMWLCLLQMDFQDVCCCCCCRPHSTNVLPAESSTRIMWQPTVSPPRWQGKAPLCRDSSRGPG